MGPRVETRRLEVLAHVCDDGGRLGRQRDRRMLHQSIDVVDPEPDSLEMESGDGAAERLGLFDQPAQLVVPADNGQEVVEPGLRRLPLFGGHDRLIVAPDRVNRMTTARDRIQPPDLSEKGGMKDGAPQRSDDRLFMQLMVFGGCTDAAAVAGHIRQSGVEGAVYENVNDPRGVAVLSLTRT